MLIEMVRHTPSWVWPVLALLLWRGYALTRPQLLPLGRLAILPGVLTLLSLAGVLTTFRAQTAALLCWAAGLAWSAYATQRHGAPAGACYRPERRSFELPGSRVPLMLIVLIFAVKYTVGMQLALHPSLRQAGWFALVVSSGYGMLSGVFLGWTLRLRHVWRQSPPRGSTRPFTA
jgi:hypothetical protein